MTARKLAFRFCVYKLRRRTVNK